LNYFADKAILAAAATKDVVGEADTLFLFYQYLKFGSFK
jgi:hypothetical protein